jgi:hypothetical protein
MGPDHYALDEDELSIVGSRSGDQISLGDRMAVVIDDVAIMRRTVYARRVVPESVLEEFGDQAKPGQEARPRRDKGFLRPGSRPGQPARFVEKNRDARRPERPGERPRKAPARGATLPVSGARPPRPQGARPQGARPQGARPQGARPQGARPQDARAQGGARKANRPKRRGGR